MGAHCCKATSRAIVESKNIEWMKNLPIDLHNVPITKIAIPGTHDSFAFHLTCHPAPNMNPNLKRFHIFIIPFIKSWSITQHLTIAEQLNIGIRYFDLRVCPTTDVSLAKRSPFSFAHGLLGDLVRHGLEEINEFLNKHTKEIVLLDFNHFYDFNDQCGHEQLVELIYDVFGKKICTTAQTLNECTLNYLWNNNQQVIILYEQDPNQCKTYIDRIGHFFQVCQSPWPNAPQVDNLFIFLNKEVSKPRPTTYINVVQGQITPHAETIEQNPFSSLRRCARDTNRQLIKWLPLHRRDPSLIEGINVVICDFADQEFTDAVIMLNYKTSIE